MFEQGLEHEFESSAGECVHVSDSILKRFSSIWGSFQEFSNAKLGVRTAEEVLAHSVLTPGSKRGVRTVLTPPDLSVRTRVLTPF